MITIDDDRLYTVGQAGDVLGVDVKTIARWCNAGVLAPIHKALISRIAELVTEAIVKGADPHRLSLTLGRPSYYLGRVAAGAEPISLAEACQLLTALGYELQFQVLPLDEEVTGDAD